jgi:hypothetical protein
MADDDDDRDRKLAQVGAEAESETRDVYLKDGRTLTIGSQAGKELVEIRSSSGQVEVRIVLTEQGPVLQMDAVKLELHAEEKIELASKRVEIKASEEMEIEAKADLRVRGNKIWLN